MGSDRHINVHRLVFQSRRQMLKHLRRPSLRSRSDSRRTFLTVVAGLDGLLQFENRSIGVMVFALDEVNGMG